MNNNDFQTSRQSKIIADLRDALEVANGLYGKYEGLAHRYAREADANARLVNEAKELLVRALVFAETPTLRDQILSFVQRKEDA